MTSRLVYDIECNGFLEEATVIHCMAIGDLETNEVYTYGPSEIDKGLKLLQQADLRIGHNIIRFDDQVVQKITGVTLDPSVALDTLVLSRLLYGDLAAKDSLGRPPSNLKIGSHALEAWGIRLGLHKINYTGGFEEYNDDMLVYCEHDVRVNMRLYNHLMAESPSDDAIDLEMQFASLVAAMERTGMPFDEQGAIKLYQRLSSERESIRVSLDQLFPPWTEVDRVVVPKRDNKKLGYTKGVPVTKYKTVDFNPASRVHIAKCLTAKYGWQPKEMTEGGQAKIDEVVLSKLPYPEAKTLARFFLLNKRIGMLAEGDNSWLKCVNSKTKRIHAYYNTLGTVTGRTSCRDPNLQQVPSVKSEYGKECRQLFNVPHGSLMLGADMSGLELRCLAHYMARYDDGAYAREVVEGDIHTLNQQAAGLPTRDQAKTFCYAMLYGAGDAKIGSIVGGNSAEGRRLKEEFLRNIPALGRLRDAVTSASAKGYIKGLDGRHIAIRSPHAALNSLLQSAGAILCKQWALQINKRLHEENLGERVKPVAFIHDEAQFILDHPEDHEIAGHICVSSASEAGHYYNFRCPLTAEFRTGLTWAETH